MSKEKGDAPFSTGALLTWQMTTFFYRLVSPFCDKCRTMHEKDHHLPGTFKFNRKRLRIFSKNTIKVSLSLFVDKNAKNALDNSRQLFLSGGSS